MARIPFPLRSNPAAVKFVGEPRLINCYAEDVGQEQKTPVSLRGIPGQVAFGSAGVTLRGGIYIKELSAAYIVRGATVYKVNSAGTETALSGFIDGSKPVIMERGAERFMSATVDISIASPGIITWINHRQAAGNVIQFSTTGELPTGLAIETDYYILSSGLTANTFKVALTAGGAVINTSGVQSGVQTATRTAATYQIGMVSDGKTWCIEDDHIIEVPLEEVANSITMLANRFVLSHASGRNSYSGLNDLLSEDGLQFFTAEARPDGMVRAIASGGELYLMGTETTEIYQPSVDSDQPFVPLSGTFIDKGSASAQTAVGSFDNAPHWLGNDDIVYRGAGYKAERISSHAVERAVKAVTDKTTIKAYIDTSEGHAFYVLTCPQWTWVFDAATHLWHERKSKGYDYWRAWPYIAAFSKRLVGDPETGAIRYLSDDVFTEDGVVMRAELILPDVPGELEHDAIEFDVATGVGLNVASTAIGYDPLMMLSWSDDGGYVFKNERTKSLGKIGEYDKHVSFNRLGTARTIRGRRYKVAISDPVPHTFALADLQAS